MSRELASLALAWMRQNGQLKVRQREQLRRALAAAAQFLCWGTIIRNPVETATKDVAKLARSGTRSITRELDNELASKRSEMTQLKKAARALYKLAEEGDFTEPIEFSYWHTARKPAQGLVTEMVTLTLIEAQEATDAAQAIEKRLESWDKLRKLMLEELREDQQRLDEMRGSLPEFVEASSGLVQEVFAIMV